MRGINNSLIKKQLLRFIVAGMTAVGTDMSVYYILMDSLPKEWAKGISFLTGTVVAYIVNKFWTFQQHKRSYQEIVKFILLYLFTLAVNVSVNELILSFDSSFILAGFIMATGCSAGLNFIGQKYWVFK